MPYLILSSLLIFSSIAMAGEFSCHFNIAKKNEEINSENLNSLVKKFNFNPDIKDGRESSFGNFTVQLVTKESRVQFLLKESKELKFEMRTSYNKSDDEIKVIIPERVTLWCLKGNKLIGIKGKPEEKLFSLPFAEDDDLTTFTGPLAISALKTLVFSYNRDPMRSLYFSGGETSSSTSESEWCVLRIRDKTGGSVEIWSGTRIPIIALTRSDSGSLYDAFSFSFVDFKTGKALSQFSGYTPFTFDCRLKKGRVMSKRVINEITGNRISILTEK